MNLSSAQSQIAKDLHRFRVVNIGRRGGKTTLAGEEIKGMAWFKTSRSCYIAPTYQQARDIIWESLKKELLPISISINESRLEIKVRNANKEESIVMLRGWESVETLRGQAFDLLVLDEVAMMRNFSIHWEEVIRPTLTDRKGIALFISTPKGFNHFYDLYNKEAKDADYKSFHFTSYDNPYIPKEEIDKARLEMTEDRFAQEYLADFRKTEGLVYKQFDRSKHVYSSDNKDDNYKEFEKYEKLAGLDWGFTHPAAVITVEKTYNGTYFVDNEYYHTGKTEDDVADYTAGQNFTRVYPDPENASGIEMLRRKKVNIRDVNKGKDSVVSGISVVQELFKSNKLFINKRCVNLINELETYSYKEERDQTGSKQDELPLKEHDDAVDALRYVLMMSERSKQGNAVIHYSPSSMPMPPNDQTRSRGPGLGTQPTPNQAYTHVPRL